MPIAWTVAMLVGFAFPLPPSFPPPIEGRSWEDEVVYVVIVERFADGDPANNVMARQYNKDWARYEGGFRGGDLKGVIDHLDDLAELGVTAILLYPVMQNDEHPVGKFLPTGYRPKDYERVDRNFGDLATLQRLIDAAHARGIKVILDMPIVLPGFEHPFVTDPARKDWFGEPSAYGVRRWKVENPEVADYIIGVARRWKERSGCDGFRIDSAQLQPAAFWKRFVAEVKAAPPGRDGRGRDQGEFLILAELAVNPRQIGRIVAECGFDGAYDFSSLACREVFGKSQGREVGMLSFVAREAHQFYPAPGRMMAEIDNYEDAFAAMADEPKAARMALALAWILTLDRVPLLYPGDELGVAIREVGGAFPPGDGRRESPVLKQVQALIALRRRERALRRGTFTEVLARDGLYAFLRTDTDGGDRILVILNASSRAQSFAATIGGVAWDTPRLDDLLAGGIARPAGSGASVELKPLGARVLKVRPAEGR